MSEQLSTVESLALKVARPEKLGEEVEFYRDAVLHPTADHEFYPYSLRPGELPDGLTENLQLGQMRRFLAACGDDANTGGANYKELMDQLDGDPIVLAAYLVFPDQKDLRQELISEMVFASTNFSEEKKDHLIVSPQGERENNLLEFALTKMAKNRQPEEEKVESTLPDLPVW